MSVFSLQGPPAPSRDEAVALAIAEAASDFDDLAPAIVIHVMQVVEVNGMWKAVVRVSFIPAPDLEEEALEETLERREQKPTRSHDVEPVEVHYIKTHSYDEGVDLSLQDMADEPHIPVHIYVPSLHEPGDLYRADHYEQHPHYHFHFLEPDSSLWHASLDHHPSLDMVETMLDAVQKEAEAEPQPKPALESEPWFMPAEPDASPQPDRKRKPKGLTLDIVTDQ